MEDKIKEGDIVVLKSDTSESLKMTAGCVDYISAVCYYINSSLSIEDKIIHLDALKKIDANQNEAAFHIKEEEPAI